MKSKLLLALLSAALLLAGCANNNEPSGGVGTYDAATVKAVVKFNTVTLRGRATSSDGELPWYQGFLFADNEDMTDAEEIDVPYMSGAIFEHTVSDLDYDETYYYQAYVEYNGKRTYGEVESVETYRIRIEGICNASNFGALALLSGQVNTMDEVTAVGFEVSDNEDFSDEQDYPVTIDPDNGYVSGDHFSATITGLEFGGTYYYRVYAVIDGQRSYSGVQSFTTASSFSYLHGRDAIDQALFDEIFDTIDADGDGYKWQMLDGYIMSASWNGMPRNPDNYLLFPPLLLKNTSNINMTLKPSDLTWCAEKFQILISDSPITAGSGEVLFEHRFTDRNQVEANINVSSEYAGKTVYIAVRHFDTYDQFYLYLTGIDIITE